MLTMNRSSANFLADPDLDDRVQQMYAADRDGQGYVSNLTRSGRSRRSRCPSCPRHWRSRCSSPGSTSRSGRCW